MADKNRTHLKIITPEGIFYNQPVSIVTVKTTEGYIGLQPGRIPIVGSIEISPLIIGTKGQDNYMDCAIAGGLLYADKTSVTIITDAVEEKAKIDLKRAESEKEKAEQALKSQKDAAEVMKLKLSLQKAINRISVGRS
ncbi:ATP synthase F1 subunit epsilon [Mycoplasma marinum]|uniref:ATP synthase epsilon chain n=1 Tax=Mycoplasma marinum TaxID=1937190 RepID=A0A4R0XMU1_9MOLU|nr:ATP synthase F1 subunit epsilon [Mycoplasma marinum]TCG12031.1 ATP synthase F1 subunit epsilon [Mycoplasma marinum]